ncbi:MAG: cytochrome c [Chloroflexi bacterium]|nr:cytochrome c [Chloroflexota bacterium]
MRTGWLGRIGVAATMAGALLAIGQVTVAADPAAGKAAYDKNACGACHGAKGEGGGGPALTGAQFASKYSTAEKLADVVRKGTSKGMPGYAEDKISGADMEGLVAYVQSLNQVAGAAPSKAEAPAKPPAAVKATSPESTMAAEKPLEPERNGWSFEQVYAIVVAAIGLFLMFIFAVVLNGPLRIARR